MATEQSNIVEPEEIIFNYRFSNQQISFYHSVEDKVKRRDCPELPFPGEGEYVVNELFYMRVGTLRLRQRWIDPDAVLRGQIFLTAFSALVLLLSGFALGWVAARWSLPPVTTNEFEFGRHTTLTTSSWVENVAFGNGGGGGGCDCDHENLKLALGSLKNSSSSLYY